METVEAVGIAAAIVAGVGRAIKRRNHPIAELLIAEC
jgi:hypothetical protein